MRERTPSNLRFEVARGLWWAGNLLSRDLSEQGDGGGRLAIRASEVVTGRKPSN